MFRFRSRGAWRGEPALDRGSAVDQTHAAVAKFPHRPALVRKQLQQAVGEPAHRRTSARRARVRSGAAASRRPARARLRARRSTSASAATSARPRFRPWPASGCTTCAASPSSTQPGAAHRLGRAPAAAARRRARWPAQARRRRRARGLVQRCFEGRGVQRQQRVGARLRHRPDQRVRALGCRAVERQQRQHVGRAEPLARHAGVRPVATRAARRSRAGRRRGARSARRARRACAEALPSHTHGQRRRHRRVDHARTCGAKRTRVGQRAAPARPRRRSRPARRRPAPRPRSRSVPPRVAFDVHVVHGGAASAGSASQTFSCAAASRGGVQRIGAHVGARRVGGGRRAAAPRAAPGAPAPAPGSRPTTPAPADARRRPACHRRIVGSGLGASRAAATIGADHERAESVTLASPACTSTR